MNNNFFANFQISGPFLNYLKNLLKSNDSTFSKQNRLENDLFLNIFENKNNLMFIKFPLFARFSNELKNIYNSNKKIKLKNDLPFSIIISSSLFVLSILIKHQLNLDENTVNINLKDKNVKFTYLASKVEEFIINKRDNKLPYSYKFVHGFYVLNIMLNTLYFELVKGEDSTIYFTCTKKVLDHIEEYFSVNYINLPMVHPPRFWTDLKNGGFISKTNLIHINHAISNHQL
jgi:DNA-directed RNA polymerase